MDKVGEIKFYKLGKDEFDIADFGDKFISGYNIMVGDGRGSWRGGEPFYRKPTQLDYDECFIHKLLDIQPVTACFKLLDYHFDYYMHTENPQSKEFIRHLKYNIVPIIRRSARQEVANLIEEWIGEKS